MDTAIVTRAVGAVDAAVGVEVGAVDQRDVVPEAVGDGVLELRDAVRPYFGGVFGDLEGVVGVEGFGPGAAGDDERLGVGVGAPVERG